MPIQYTEADVTESDNTETVEYKKFDEGTYYCEVKEVRDGKKPNQFCICFKEVKSGDIICWDYLTFSGKALGIANKKIKTIDPNFEVGKEYNEQNLVGKRVTLLVEFETFNGKTSLRPKFKSDNFGYTKDEDIPF